MISPALLVLTAFVLLPIAGSLYLAFTEYDLFTPPELNGIANFRRMLADARLWVCFRNTVAVALGSVVGTNVVGLLLAMGVNRGTSKGFRYFFRTSMFFPVVTTASSLAIVWQVLLATDRGVINMILGQFGIKRIPWLTSSVWAIRSVILYQIWRSLGLIMITYLAGLQGIPGELYEAGRIDGCNSWRLTRHITLPLLTPTVFFNIVMGFIGGFQIFEASWILTGGGPGDASRTIAAYLYELAFRYLDMGYGAAVALALTLLLICLTMLQFWIGNRWVHYD